MILLEAAATTLQGPGEGGGPLDGFLIRSSASPARQPPPPGPALARPAVPSGHPLDGYLIRGGVQPRCGWIAQAVGSRANPPPPSKGLPPQGTLPHGGAPPSGAHPLQGGGVPSNRLHHGGRWPCR